MLFRLLAVWGLTLLLLGSISTVDVDNSAVIWAMPAAPQEPTEDVDQANDYATETTGEDAQANNDGETDDDSKDDDSEDEKQDDKLVLDGTFVSARTHSIRIEPDEWTKFTIVSVVDHGAVVSKGDTLIECDAKELDAAIRDAEIEQRLGRLSLAGAEDNLDLLKKTNPLALADAERTERNAAEDLKRFLTQGRQQTKKSLEFSVKSTENRLAYQEEELRQLEKMYEADEITEETEEIILRRTRDAVESARYSLERAMIARERGLEVDLPRTEAQLEKSVTDASVALEKARLTLPREIRQEEITLEKTRITRESSDEKLDRLRQDRRLMTIRAPAAGTVYYGDFADGSLSGVAAALTALRPGQTVKVKQNVLTIVQMRPLTLQAKLEEKNFRKVRAGDTAKVKPAAFPDQELTARVVEISTIPVGPGQFGVQLSVDVPAGMTALVPGMTAKIEFPTAGAATQNSDNK